MTKHSSEEYRLQISFSELNYIVICGHFAILIKKKHKKTMSTEDDNLLSLKKRDKQILCYNPHEKSDMVANILQMGRTCVNNMIS